MRKPRQGWPIYKISPSVIKELTKDLFALQDKRLLE